MPKILIEVEMDEGDEFADPSDATGVTNEAYERLTGISEEPPLGWLGEVTDVRRA